MVSFRTGDVFLFEHDDSCISRLICKLSHSPISHAAMYFEDNSIIEEGMPYIGTRRINELGDRAVHVRRSRFSSESSRALHDVAQQRLEAKEPYSMGNLLAVGILLVFTEWKPNAHWAVKQALSAVCILLAKVVDARKLHGKHGSTCSQLVYEMYEEAGFPLVIKFRSESTLNGDGSCLAARTLAFVQSGEFDTEKFASDKKMGESNFDLESICCALLAILGASDQENAAENADDVPEVELYDAVIRFAELLAHADAIEEDFAADENRLVDWAQKVMTHLLQQYSGFVSPGQLYADCPDLAQEIAVLSPPRA